MTYLYEPCSEKNAWGDPCGKPATHLPHQFKRALCWIHLSQIVVDMHVREAEEQIELRERAYARAEAYKKAGRRVSGKE